MRTLVSHQLSKEILRKGISLDGAKRRRKRRCRVAESVVAPPSRLSAISRLQVAAGAFETPPWELKHNPSPWENTRVIFNIAKPCQCQHTWQVFKSLRGNHSKIYEKKMWNKNSCIIPWIPWTPWRFTGSRA